MKIIMTMIIIGLMTAGMAGFASGASMKIYPSADAYVQDKTTTDKNTNYGSCTTNPSHCQSLRVGYNINYGKDRSYLRFDLSSLSGKNLTSAVFSIHALTPHSNPNVNLYLVRDNWYENSITWNNKPANYSLISSKLFSATGRASFTMPISYLNGTSLSFVMIEEGENADVSFYSKDLNTGNSTEDAFYWPYLEVSYLASGESSCPSTDYSNVCCSLSSVQMMNFINKFNKFEVLC